MVWSVWGEGEVTIACESNWGIAQGLVHLPKIQWNQLSLSCTSKFVSSGRPRDICAWWPQ